MISLNDKLKTYKNKLIDNYFARASITYIFSAMLLKGFALFTTPIFTRLLSSEQYGEYSNAITYASFLSIIVTAQLSASIPTARIHLNKLDLKEYIANLLILELIIAISVCLVLYWFRDILSIYLKLRIEYFIPVLIIAFGSSMDDTINSYFVSSKKPKKKMRFSFIVTLLNLILGLILVLLINDKRGLARVWSVAITGTCSIVFGLVYFNHGYEIKAKNEILNCWRYGFKYGTPLLFHVLSSRIITLSDRLFINNMGTKSEVAIYSVVYSVGHLGLVFAQACNAAWAPWYFDKTKNGDHRIINNYAKIYICIIAFIYCFFVLFSREILSIMAPPEYQAGSIGIIFISIGVFFQFLYTLPALYEQYMRRVKIQSICTIIAALINLGLNYIFIKFFGVIGATVATLISYLVLFLLHELIARKIVKNFNIEVSTYCLPIAILLLSCGVAFIANNLVWVRIVTITIILVFLLIYITKNIERK